MLPGLTTLPGAMLIGISSPYRRAGLLFDRWRQHYGRDGGDDDGVLVVKGPSRTFNPTVPQRTVDAALARDPEAAAAEWLGEWRRDIAQFIDRGVVDSVIAPGRHELPPISGTAYTAFVDPSGGSSDSMTLAIAHPHKSVAILDCLRERRPPFSPEAVVIEFAETLRAYGITAVVGDRYAGEWPRERFRQHGIEYLTAPQPKSDLYGSLLPLLNSGRVEMLDHPKLIAQLVGLERRTARAGRDSIDHAPHAHDDLVNAAAGALVAAARAQQSALICAAGFGSIPLSPAFSEFGSDGAAANYAAYLGSLGQQYR